MAERIVVGSLKHRKCTAPRSSGDLIDTTVNRLPKLSTQYTTGIADGHVGVVTALLDRLSPLSDHAKAESRRTTTITTNDRMLFELPGTLQRCAFRHADDQKTVLGRPRLVAANASAGECHVACSFHVRE